MAAAARNRTARRSASPVQVVATCVAGPCNPELTTYPAASKSLLQWLMVGDSISIQAAESSGFEAEARRRGLQPVHSHGNACSVARGLRCLTTWLGDEPARWDLISFNFGLHRSTGAYKCACCQAFDSLHR